MEYKKFSNNITSTNITDDNFDWEHLLNVACKFHKIFPDGILIGGSVASIYAMHRVSFDIDFVFNDLKEKFEKFIDILEKGEIEVDNVKEEWEWELARMAKGKVILGNFDGVETGLRQLMRTKPLETTLYEVKPGKFIKIPTIEETLRTKAWMILSRNATRDYLDFCALAKQLYSEDPARLIKAMESFDDYYIDMYDKLKKRKPENKKSPLLQLLKQLAEPKPFDLNKIDLKKYKGIVKPWTEWKNIKKISQDAAVVLTEALTGIEPTFKKEIETKVKRDNDNLMEL
ncbi:hypothetical protein DEFDS_P073 (plasmid) [Deferribacter desulfuricans SSM1]|uniref:Nucleotidyl transferase AbiEii/AbiGii toxin family protein n=2 Tax=Deferribacter TaxID=53572 RepID=D3PEQ5_DEFDS|nr:hypothetical protein DEFDS_P073 [Deferribacter desulfuricans SSM1]